MPAPFPGLRHGAELSVCARASGRGARSLTGWGSDRVLGVGPCAPARSGSEAGLGWVTSSGGSVGCGDFADPGVIHGDVPSAPVDEAIGSASLVGCVCGCGYHSVGAVTIKK